MATEQAKISALVLAFLRMQAVREYPRECCGLLLGHFENAGGRIVQARPMRNVSGRPRHGFAFDALEQLQALREADAAGLEVLGHYHSHPNGRQGPSPTDLELAQTRLDFGLWLILAVAQGRLLETSVWRLVAEKEEFVRLSLDMI